jgi:hypothetical protein
MHVDRVDSQSDSFVDHATTRIMPNRRAHANEQFDESKSNQCGRYVQMNRAHQLIVQVDVMD